MKNKFFTRLRKGMVIHMRIVDLLDSKSIELNRKLDNKQQALDAAIDLMVKSGKINDEKKYRQGVYDREKEGTTGIGEGVAIPHCKSDAVKEAGLSAIVVKDGVDFEALDGEKVMLIFLIAAPNTQDNIHIELLSKLSVLLLDEQFTKDLIAAKTVEEFIQIVDIAEAKVDQENKEHGNLQQENTTKILAVTGCPTGIAHTYMAAESLQKKAQQKGLQIKVETRGSGGAKNILTNKEIEEADCIIVASDTQVPMERFNGKKLIITSVSEGISKADKLIDRAIKGEGSVYHADSTSRQESQEREGAGIGHQIYKHLMNGVSHMLPFVVGGGILIAIAFLIDGFSIDISSLSKEARGNFGSITPVAAMFKNIGGMAFGFMLPILAGFIASSIADRPGLAVGFVGGAIAAHGTSGFLGALVAGFIAGYIVVLLRKIFSKLPESLEGLKPVLLFPLFGILIIGLIMLYVIEPPIGILNTMLNNGLSNMSGASKIVLGALLGGMMSVDMGGPVNKAAYVFGTASIAAGNYGIMAAVMVGGMVPPLAIAISTLIFKNKYTLAERKAGPTNFIMGLSFITEGAIPYAAADPVRVILSCIVGSALAGALSMAFNCTLMAPHGGIFVFPVVGNAILYLLALIIGSVASAFILGVVKKKQNNEE